MKKTHLLCWLFFFCTSYAFAEQPTEPETLTRIYDTQNHIGLLVEGGMNFLKKCPPGMKSRDFSAYLFDSYLYYAIRIKQSRFTFCPGIAYSRSVYCLEKDRELIRVEKDREKVFFSNFPGNSTVKNIECNSSRLNVNYVYALAEMRFNINSACLKEGFFVALGIRGGCLCGASTKLAYKEDDEGKTRIQTEGFKLRRFVYGFQGRVGYSRFSLCYKHTMSTLFQKDRGPEKTQVTPYSFGITLDLF